MVRLATWMAAGVVCAGAARGQGFCDRVKALTEEPAVAAAHWGVSVTAMDGTVLCAVNAGQLFRPASNDKLLTAAAALALLGPERRFTTTVVADGELKDGVLNGNLRLVGGGDANFGSQDVPYLEPARRPKPALPEPATIADIEELADQIVAKGVRAIAGDVVGDDSFFADDPYPPGWGVDDLVEGFGAPVSALTIHDSELEVELTPAAKAGDEAGISFRPEVEYYGTESSAVTAPASASQPVRGHLRLDRPVGSMQLRLAGGIPLNAAPVKVEVAIQEPAQFAAKALREALERRGVKVAGVTLAQHGPDAGRSPEDAATAAAEVAQLLTHPERRAVSPACVTLALKPKGATLGSHLSPRVDEDVLFTLKESQNLHAEVLLRDLAAIYTCDSTRATGLSLIRAYLLQAGIEAGDFVLYDGSGLSARDLVTPRALTQLLVYAAKQPWFASFKASLPVGGVDGTLANRFAAGKSPLTGKVFAKTGTLGETRDLAGYVTAADGRTLVFSVMVDNHLPGGGDAPVMDRIVETMAGFTGR